MGDFVTYEKIPERAVLIAVARFVQAMDHPSSVSYLGSRSDLGNIDLY